MPSLTFVLPHWMYWGLLIGFPLLAMVMARRSETMRSSERTLPIGYFILITGGILGLHRLYMKNLWGLLYLPLFLVILYANGEQRSARELVSNAANDVRRAESALERERPRIEELRAELPALREAVAAVEADPDATVLDRRRAERGLSRAEDRLQTSSERVAEAEVVLETARPRLEETQAAQTFWNDVSLYAFLGILAFMALDAMLMPMLARRANEKLRAAAATAAAETA
ncbi:MAG: small integral membrane transport protein, partial [Pseudomonadota bacterium]